MSFLGRAEGSKPNIPATSSTSTVRSAAAVTILAHSSAVPALWLASSSLAASSLSSVYSRLAAPLPSGVAVGHTHIDTIPLQQHLPPPYRLRQLRDQTFSVCGRLRPQSLCAAVPGLPAASQLRWHSSPKYKATISLSRCLPKVRLQLRHDLGQL